MKKSFAFLSVLLLNCLFLLAQNNKEQYPIPEYSNEINLLIKDSAKLLRLEKANSKQEMKLKMMGMGGMDQGYEMEGEKSTVRLTNGSNLVFIIFTGEVTTQSNPQTDSIMRANGMDPSMMSGMSSMMDPTQSISLYNMKEDKGNRKILTQSMGLMGKSKKTATKYTLSTKKVKENYYEMIVDKTLPKGEYAFVMMSMSMDQSFKLFAFGID